MNKLYLPSRESFKPNKKERVSLSNENKSLKVGVQGKNISVI